MTATRGDNVTVISWPRQMTHHRHVTISWASSQNNGEYSTKGHVTLYSNVGTEIAAEPPRYTMRKWNYLLMIPEKFFKCFQLKLVHERKRFMFHNEYSNTNIFMKCETSEDSNCMYTFALSCLYVGLLLRKTHQSLLCVIVKRFLFLLYNLIGVG